MENNYENIKIEDYVLDDTEIAEMLSGSRLTRKYTGKSTKPTKHY